MPPTSLPATVPAMHGLAGGQAHSMHVPLQLPGREIPLAATPSHPAAHAPPGPAGSPPTPTAVGVASVSDAAGALLAHSGLASAGVASAGVANVGLRGPVIGPREPTSQGPSHHG